MIIANTIYGHYMLLLKSLKFLMERETRKVPNDRLCFGLTTALAVAVFTVVAIFMKLSPLHDVHDDEDVENGDD
jgi:hypothetical protein